MTANKLLCKQLHSDTDPLFNVCHAPLLKDQCPVSFKCIFAPSQLIQMVQLCPRHIRDFPTSESSPARCVELGEKKRKEKKLQKNYFGWTPLLSSIKKDPEKRLTIVIHVHIVSNIKFLSFDL